MNVPILGSGPFMRRIIPTIRVMQIILICDNISVAYATSWYIFIFGKTSFKGIYLFLFISTQKLNVQKRLTRSRIRRTPAVR